MSDDVMITAAIDFGTMYSGYSYSFKSNPEDIRVNKDWASGDVGTTVTKAPTCVLIKQTTQEEPPTLLAFGFDAQQKYKAGENNEHEYFYDEFKMELYQDKQIGKPGYIKKIKSLDEKRDCDATIIFSMALGFLKDQLLKDINERLENKLEAKNIQWVLTVPAIWSDGAKRFMRKCAQLGGVVDDEDSERLLVSLEPECAAMYCRGLKEADITDPSQGFTGISEKTKYLVVDCGGGTVDITAHETKDEDEICELFARSSHDWGGRRIDKKFEERLKNIMGDTLYNKFTKEKTSLFLDLKNKFEKSKGSIKFDDPTYRLNLPLSNEFNTLCSDVTTKTFDQIIKASGDVDVSLRTGNLSFNRKAIDEMFQPIVDRICNHVVLLLKDPAAGGMDYTFLAGGFSDCGSLQLTMRERVSEVESLKHMKIITPNEAVLTIMKGAVKFGYNPQAISSRKSRLTYGTCVHEKYDPANTKHKLEHRVIGKDGQLYCSNIFYPLLGKGDTIIQDDVLDFVFQPLWDEQDELEFDLYSVNEHKNNVKYVTDQNMKKQTIRVKLDKKASYKEKPVRLLLYFGSTELHIQVVDDNDPHKKKGEASLDLLEAK